MSLRLFNPAEFIGSSPRLLSSGVRSRKPRQSAIRSTQATVRAMRLVRKAAVAKFGRGKAELHYAGGRWVVRLHDYQGVPVGVYSAYDTSPGVDGTGIDFLLMTGGRLCP